MVVRVEGRIVPVEMVACMEEEMVPQEIEDGMRRGMDCTGGEMVHAWRKRWYRWKLLVVRVEERIVQLVRWWYAWRNGWYRWRDGACMEEEMVLLETDGGMRGGADGTAGD
ncbi:hypothetical protein NDU88_000377 [Pleurodeles waltl]|uniref:Uncharacterized protein n=1 Tax=Pleurodeles waltl TaxID=8319 RepID=A0AAV7MHJ2_PLEWA|nr:hypothetical protein NDU88_000377 [Pleurodeles waltl]